MSRPACMHEVRVHIISFSPLLPMPQAPRAASATESERKETTRWELTPLIQMTTEWLMRRMSELTSIRACNSTQWNWLFTQSRSLHCTCILCLYVNCRPIAITSPCFDTVFIYIRQQHSWILCLYIDFSCNVRLGLTPIILKINVDGHKECLADHGARRCVIIIIIISYDTHVPPTILVEQKITCIHSSLCITPWSRM